MKIVVYCDGGSRGNPGASACAFVVHEDRSHGLETDSMDTDIVRGKSGKPFDFAQGKYLGVGTNNEAEYMAVVEAWKWINSGMEEKKEDLKIEFYLDSNLAVNQINGNFKVKEPRLQELLAKVRAGETKFNFKVTYAYVPREKNFEADKLVNETLDRHLLSKAA